MSFIDEIPEINKIVSKKLLGYKKTNELNENNRFKFISITLIVVLLLTVLGGCAQKTGTALRVNEVTHSIFYAPFYAAINLGFFNEKNIKMFPSYLIS